MRHAHDQVHEAQQALHRCLMFPIADERPSCYEERAAPEESAGPAGVLRGKGRSAFGIGSERVQHELFEYEGRISQLVRTVEVDVPQAMGVLTQDIARHLEDYQAVRATDPRAAYNDVVACTGIVARRGERRVQRRARSRRAMQAATAER